MEGPRMRISASVLGAPDPPALPGVAWALESGATLADYQPRSTCACCSTRPGTRSVSSRAGKVEPGGVWVPGGPPGLQNRWTARGVVGGFDSRPPPLLVVRNWGAFVAER